MEVESKNLGIEGEVNGFSLIDFSIADDSFLVPASEPSENDIMGGMLADGSPLLHPPESREPEGSKRQETCNLRKSLAWDSSFFTSAGVLDPEELSSIIEGAEESRGQKQLLPKIHEDLSKSTDSVSTFETDTLTIKCLEADLFCDIRASIQRSSKVSNPGNKNSGAGSCETEGDDSLSSAAVESASGNMVKPKPGSDKLSTSIQGQGKTTRLGSAGVQAGARGRGSILLVPRPHEMAYKASSIATHVANKRTPVAAIHSKSDSGDAINPKVAGRGTVVSRFSHAGDSRGGETKRMIAVRSSSGVSSLRSSSGASVIHKGGIPSCHSSCDSYTSSSETKSNCTSNAGQMKLERTVTLPFSAKLKNPPLISSKTKSLAGNSHRTTLVKSTSKILPNVSPVSSVSERSTESSSSTVTNQKLASSKGCINSCTHDKLETSDLQKQARDENQVTGLLSQSAQQTSMATGPFAHAVSAKPSGLRLPSPTIGFFDGVKAGGKAPNGGLQPHPGVSSNLTRSEAVSQSPGDSSTKRTFRNMTSKSSPAVSQISKVDTPKTLDMIKRSASPGEAPITAEKTPHDRNIENCLETLSGYKDGSLEAKVQFLLMSGRESDMKCTETPDVRKPLEGIALSGRKKGTADSLKNRKFLVAKTRLSSNLDSSKLSAPISGTRIKGAVLKESSSHEKVKEAEKLSELQNEVENDVPLNCG